MIRQRSAGIAAVRALPFEAMQADTVQPAPDSRQARSRRR